MDLWLDDPDPHIRELAMIAFLDDVIGRGFVERWARMNDCQEWMEERLRELEELRAVMPGRLVHSRSDGRKRPTRTRPSDG